MICWDTFSIEKEKRKRKVPIRLFTTMLESLRSVSFGLSLSLSLTLNKELSVSQIRFFCGHWITCGSDIFNFVQSRRYLFTKGIIFLCLFLKCLAPYRFGCKGKVENENRFIGGKTNIELKVKEKNNNRQIEKSVCRQDNTHIHV